MKFSPLQTPFRVTLGGRGEMIAGGYLSRHGYKIIESNYRCKIGEIDIICKKDGRIFFVEVKTRTNEQFGRPEESVGMLKQRKLVQLANWYLKEKKLFDSRISFAVLAVQLKKQAEPEIKMIEDAFQAG